MAKVKELHLEPLSKALARRLIEEFPEWEAYLGSAEREEDGLVVNILRIVVPSANPQMADPLEITAELDRFVYAHWFFVTDTFRWHIDWPYYHLAPHFGDGSPSPWENDPRGLDQIVEWLLAFLDERIVAYHWRDSDKVGGGGYCKPEAIQSYLREGRELVVHSWRGTHDDVRTGPS